MSVAVYRQCCGVIFDVQRLDWHGRECASCSFLLVGGNLFVPAVAEEHCNSCVCALLV